MCEGSEDSEVRKEDAGEVGRAVSGELEPGEAVQDRSLIFLQRDILQRVPQNPGARVRLHHLRHVHQTVTLVHFLYTRVYNNERSRTTYPIAG